MSAEDGVTLGGMTASEFMDVCEKASHRDAKAQLAASDVRRPLSKTEQLMLDLGVITAVKATFEELVRRGLVVDRP